MILARIQIEEDDYDWFRGLCQLPALPPVGSLIRLMDRNANMRDLRVREIVIDGFSVQMDSETPGGLGSLKDEQQRITIVCSETWGSSSA